MITAGDAREKRFDLGNALADHDALDRLEIAVAAAVETTSVSFSPSSVTSMEDGQTPPFVL